jgi:hypothetical protein
MIKINRVIILILGVIYFICAEAHAGWDLYEQTNVKGSISGSIEKGTIIEMKSGGVYQVHERVRLRVRERNSEAIVLRDGRYFKLIIDGFDEPLVCIQLVEPGSKASAGSPSNSEVINTYIEGTFEGWDGETIFKMDNGQIWQQSSYAYMYYYAYHPEVMIINTGGVWKMKVEGVDEMIDVIRLK